IVFAGPEEVRVESRLEKPRPRTSGFELRLAADGDGTLVTWTANCENDRAASLAELLTGPLPPTAADLEKGLENLKVVAEAAAESARAQLPIAASTQFDITGYIEEATLDPSCVADPHCGGTIKVNGHVVVVPKEIVVMFPANALTWQEMFAQAPPPYGLGAA